MCFCFLYHKKNIIGFYSLYSLSNWIHWRNTDYFMLIFNFRHKKFQLFRLLIYYQISSNKVERVSNFFRIWESTGHILFIKFSWSMTKLIKYWLFFIDYQSSTQEIPFFRLLSTIKVVQIIWSKFEISFYCVKKYYAYFLFIEFS